VYRFVLDQLVQQPQLLPDLALQHVLAVSGHHDDTPEPTWHKDPCFDCMSCERTFRFLDHLSHCYVLKNNCSIGLVSLT
jgi:hypothetical protein